MIDEKRAMVKRYDRTLFAMCGLAGLLYGIDIGLIASALPYIRATCAFSEMQLSSLVAAVLLGTIPGTLCATWVSERIGRLAALKVTALVFAAAVPLICLSDGSFALMFAGRILQGLGCGFMGIAAALYVVECARKENRGFGTGMLQLVLTVGLVVAALIGLGVVSFFGAAESETVPVLSKTRAWQTIFALSALPPVVLFFGLFRLKESPRWLFAHGCREAALDSLRMNHLPDEAAAVMAEFEGSLAAKADGPKAGPADSLLQRKYLAPLALAVLIPVFNQATGVNSLLNYSVELMQRAGLAGTDANMADSVIKFANFLFTCLAMYLVDRCGRKVLLSVGIGGVLAGLVAVGGLFLAVEHGVLSVGPTTGWLIVAAFVLFISGFAVGPGVCVWLAMTELMPYRIRAGGMMVAQFVAMGVSYVLAQTFLPWSKAYGNSSVFLTLAVVSVFYFITVVFFLPETKGRSLEEIEGLFAGKKEGDR